MRLSRHPFALAIACTLIAGCDETTTQITTYESFEIRASLVGRYASGVFDAGAAEILSFHPASRRAFVVNAAAGTVDVLDIANLATPTLADTLDVGADVATNQGIATTALGAANSVAVNGDLVAVAIEADPKQDSGYVAFYNAATLAFIDAVSVGALPDMVTFTPDGSRVLVANEGEPSQDYSLDPEGSVSLIDVSAGATNPSVTTLDFTAFNAGNARHAELPAAVRIYGPGASVAQDLEPEYITVSSDGGTAWVTLQEANAIARIDIANASIEGIAALGFKDHMIPGFGFDATDRDIDDDAPFGGSGDDSAIRILNWPVFGIYSPDSIASYDQGGRTWLVMANEGDTRVYPDDSGEAIDEEARISSLVLDPILDQFTDAAGNNLRDAIGRLTVTNTLGDTDGDGDFDALYVPGGRSFSIRDTDGNLVWDSGDDFEVITAQRIPMYFNADNDDNDFDNRSDNKGPEPEALTLGEIEGRTFAFIGLERVGGIMIYDITNPESPRFMQYVIDRDFTADVDTPAAGDLGPEGMQFIAAANSPNGKPLLLVGNEVSGTTAIYEIAVITP
ncbi:MAG: choice-of-anchor I family protein [Pseudomonadota bacterium]